MKSIFYELKKGTLMPGYKQGRKKNLKLGCGARFKGTIFINEESNFFKVKQYFIVFWKIFGGTYL